MAKLQSPDKFLARGNGRLKAAHGYTSVKVTNLSQYDLIINKIDVSKKRDGKITIIASDTLTKTVFTTDGTQVTKTTYTGAVSGNAINYTQSGNPTIYGLADAIEYAVQPNLHYVWTEGQEKTQVTTTKYEQNSFNLIGWDWGLPGSRCRI